ncbi:tyrosine-type recombinase/integrase [Akkermansiaceae bacterium]|nr:tyrosine-type recombinase/integrase [Akkermansiaceae bacterium]
MESLIRFPLFSFTYRKLDLKLRRHEHHRRRTGKGGSYEGKTPALGDNEAKALLTAPPEDTLKGIRDRAILATYLFHGLRAAELANLTPGDIQSREGVLHLRIFGKRSKIRYVPFHPAAQRLVEEYLDLVDHREERGGPIFRTLSNNRDEDNPAPLSQSSLYRNVIKKWSLVAGLDVNGVSNHAMRATAATNALSNAADIAKVQEWLGHANVSTTKLYDRRQSKPEDSPTFRVNY